MRSLKQIRVHYQIERELAEELRNAPAEERPKLYTELYNELYQRVPELAIRSREQINNRVTREMRIIEKWIDSESVFLEIGPGDCNVSFEVAKTVKEVIAIDVSDVITQHINTPRNFSLMISDGTNIPVPDNSVDVAYSNQVMEHLHPDDAQKQLKNIYQVLAPGGVYLCLTPNRLSGPHDISMYFDQIATGFHLREYTNTELVNIFIESGFSEIKNYVGVRGFYISCPLILIQIVERLFTLLPRSLRIKARGTPLNNIFISGGKSIK